MPLSDDKDAEWREVRKGSGRYVRYAWERGPLELKLDGLTFEAATDLKYRMRAGMRLPFFSGIRTIARVGTENPARMRLRFLSELALGEDWALRSKTRVEPTLVDAVKVMGMDMSGIVTAAMERSLARKMARLDRQVAARGDLRPLATQLLEKLSRPRKLPGVGAWLEMNPVGFGVSPLANQAGALAIRLQLRARPRLSFGAAPASPTTTLPPLAQVAADAPAGFRLALDAALPLAELRGRLMKAAQEGLPGAMAPSSIAVGAEAGAVTVDLDMDGWVAGTLHLRGTPKLDPDAGVVTVPDLALEVESRSALASLANRLLAERLAANLRHRMRWDLGEEIATLRAGARAALTRSLGGGLGVDGEVEGLDVQDLEVGEDALRVTLVARGQARMTLQDLDRYLPDPPD